MGRGDPGQPCNIGHLTTQTEHPDAFQVMCHELVVRFPVRFSHRRSTAKQLVEEGHTPQGGDGRGAASSASEADCATRQESRGATGDALIDPGSMATQGHHHARCQHGIGVPTMVMLTPRNANEDL